MNEKKGPGRPSKIGQAKQATVSKDGRYKDLTAAVWHVLKNYKRGATVDQLTERVRVINHNGAEVKASRKSISNAVKYLAWYHGMARAQKAGKEYVYFPMPAE